MKGRRDGFGRKRWSWCVGKPEGGVLVVRVRGKRKGRGVVVIVKKREEGGRTAS